MKIRCVLTVCALTLILFYTAGLAQSGTGPKVQNGVLDLRGWDPAKDGPVSLDGQWEFYWNRLLTPQDFQRPQLMTGFITAPKAWNYSDEIKGGVPAHGYATYRMRLLWGDHRQILALRYYEFSTAGTIFINGQKLAECGKVGESPAKAIPYLFAGVIDFFPGQKETEIVIQVSNYDQVRGGLCREMLIGQPDDLHLRWTVQVGTALLLFGSILIIGLYHLGIFISLPRFKAALYFGIYCLCIGIRAIIMDVRFLSYVAPGIGFEALYKMEIISWFIALPVMAAFLREIYPKESVGWILRMLTGIAGLGAAFILIMPGKYGDYLVDPFFLITLLAGVYYVSVLIRAALKRRKNARVFLGGLLILFILTINDILHARGTISTGLFMPIGLFVLIFSQAYALSRMFAQTYLSVNDLSVQLEGANTELTTLNRDLIYERDALSRSEHALNITQTYLRNVFNSMSSMLISVNPDGRVTQWNRSAERYTGISQEEAMSRHIWDVAPFMKRFRERFEQVVSSKHADEIRQEPLKEDSRTRYLDITMNPLSMNCVEGVVVRIDDVTELTIKDEELRQAQKMELLGNLSGGLAHDFNNILGGIVGTVSLLKHYSAQGTVAPERLKSSIEIIENCSSRASEIVRTLLAVSRRHEAAFAAVDLNEALRHVLQICRTTLDKSIILEWRYYDTPALSYADASQIEQVLLNLCINAAHGMTDMRSAADHRGGTLKVEITRIEPDNGLYRKISLAEGDYWLMQVSDTGVGMDAQTIERIFEPFFTTKEKGTGLGLAMVSGIVSQHRGHVDVYSELGVGTSFKVYLPVYAGDGSALSAPTVAVEFPRGSGLILVVDDEETIRITARELLKVCGYTVVLAAGGGEALEIYRIRHAGITAVILDLSMPVMSGEEVLEQLIGIDPDVKVLMASGFSHDQRIKHLLELGARDFIAKPFSLRELAHKLKHIIDSNSA